MKRFILLALLGSLALAVSCSNSDPTTPIAQETTRLSNFETGRIVVYVYWNNQGIPGKKVEVLETGKTELTNANGIAVFRVPVGKLTVRVYNVERGGPPLLHVDTTVIVAPGAAARVNVWECLPCE
jgi:uncharacterized protein (DUF2141 family)